MTIQFTLPDLMIFLVCMMGILIAAILVPILLNIKKMVGIISPLVEINKDSIKHSFRRVPAIIGDLEQISGDLKDTTSQMKVSFPAIIQEVEHVASTAKGSLTLASDVMEKMGSGINDTVTAYKKDNSGYFHLFEELMQLIYRSLTSGK